MDSERKGYVMALREVAARLVAQADAWEAEAAERDDAVGFADMDAKLRALLTLAEAHRWCARLRQIAARTAAHAGEVEAADTATAASTSSDPEPPC